MGRVSSGIAMAFHLERTRCASWGATFCGFAIIFSSTSSTRQATEERVSQTSIR